MHKDELYQKVKQSVLHIHDDIFPDVNVEDIMCEDNYNLTIALDKYTEYFNYTENPEHYNLNYCFKVTLNDLNDFYDRQEEKLIYYKTKNIVFDFEHKVNQHIYEEVIACQKKVNKLYFINMFVSYLLTFLLLFGITQLTHLFELNTILGGVVLASLMSFAKIIIDKKYLDVIRNKVGWRAYKHAVRRSLAFFFASVIVQSHCDNINLEEFEEYLLLELKAQVRNSVDIFLSEVF